ncbi:MAG: hypothetical protein IJN55_06205 [Alistipes sp.]|nr:hypothetical protein [Alistipes sp.]
MKAFKNILLATLMVITVLLLAYAIFTGGSDAAISWNLIWGYILLGGAVLAAVLGALWGIIQSPSGGKSSLASLVLILIVIGAAYFIATGHEEPIKIVDLQNNGFFGLQETIITEVSIIVTYVAFAASFLVALVTEIWAAFK